MSIAVGDNFELMYPGDDGFIVDDTLVRGGYSIVSTLAERDSIPPSARKDGMVVYVQTPQLEYKLQGGLDNTNWVVRNTMVDDGKTYAKLTSPEFVGNMKYTQVDTPSSAIITKVNELYNNDSDLSFLEISLTAAEKAKIGMYTFIKGESSGATAIIIALTDNGIIIPSRTAPISKPRNRVGTFLQSERIVFAAGGVIAREEAQVITLAGLEANAISKFGGRMFGQLEIRPVYRYVSEATITGYERMESLGLALVKIPFTANDKQHVHNRMTVQIVNPTDGTVNDTIETVRLMTSAQGFVIKLSDATKIAVGRKIKVMSGVTMPAEANNAVNKQYVDDIVTPIVLSLSGASFTKFPQAFDPVKNAQRPLARFIISKELFSKQHLPLFKLYRNYTVDSYTYKYEIQDEDVRVALRSLSGTDYEIVIEFWDTEPYDCEIHVI